MKYRIEVSEEQLRVIGLAVDEYMRLRMGSSMIWPKIWRMTAYPVSKLSLESTLTIPLFKSGVATSRICLMPPTKWLSRRVATVDGSMIHGERVSTLYTPSSTSSGWTVRKTSGKSRAQQTVLSNLFRWGMSRSRKSRGWKNELPVL